MFHVAVRVHVTVSWISCFCALVFKPWDHLVLKVHVPLRASRQSACDVGIRAVARPFIVRTHYSKSKEVLAKEQEIWSHWIAAQSAKYHFITRRHTRLCCHRSLLNVQDFSSLFLSKLILEFHTF